VPFPLALDRRVASPAASKPTPPFIEVATMSTVLLWVLIVLIALYLIVAMLRPEKF
jgi:K+-transporting ATPase KdpF subunit